MIVATSTKVKVLKGQVEQTASKAREIKIIKSGQVETVPVPVPAPKPARVSDAEIRESWVREKNESNQSVYRVALDFFFNVPDACMQGGARQ